MSKLLRYDRPGDIVFITAVTRNRYPYLIDNEDLLIEKFNKYQSNAGYSLVAWVVMPDHFHIILHTQNIKIANIIRKIKLSFSAHYRQANGLYRIAIWQSRYWDHIMRDNNDLNRHIDYIHYNPIKHGKVKRPCDWPYSSFHAYLERGQYSQDWGINRNYDSLMKYGE